MASNHWPPQPYGSIKRRNGLTTDRAAQEASRRAWARFVAAKQDGIVSGRSAYHPWVFGAVVNQIASRSQVYDNLNASRISALSGAPEKEARRTMGDLDRFGLLTWEPGKGNRWGMYTLARVSILTVQELAAFLALEGAVEPPQQNLDGAARPSIEGAVPTFIEGVVPTHNGEVLIHTNTENTYTETDESVFDSSSLRDCSSVLVNSAPTNTSIIERHETQNCTGGRHRFVGDTGEALAECFYCKQARPDPMLPSWE